MGEKSFKLAENVISDLKASESLGILRCIQCGMCTSVCPAARYTEYDPRNLVKKVLDNEENIVNDDIIWNCFYCYTCHSICPVNNSPCEINQILRQNSIDKGKGKHKISGFSSYGDSFLEFGLGAIPNEFFDDLLKDYGKDWLNLKVNLDDIREELGLGSMLLPQKDVEDIKNILKETGFTKRLERIKNYKDD